MTARAHDLVLAIACAVVAIGSVCAVWVFESAAMQDVASSAAAAVCAVTECQCVPCAACDGTGVLYYVNGLYIESHRIDDLSEPESCDQCAGSGIEELCEKCSGDQENE